MGPRIWTGLLLAAFLLLAVWALIRRAQPLQGWDTTWRRYYLKHFGLVFHLATLTFAAVHLSNFVFSKTPYCCCPAGAAAMAHGSGAGLDAGAQGIGAAIALHAVFNAGPIVLIWAVMRWVPGRPPGVACRRKQARASASQAAASPYA